MTPKEKAIELVSRFKDYVNPYTGSGMLSNTHDDSAIIWQAKQCALIAINIEIESFMLINLRCTFDDYMKPILEEKISELQQIEAEIENL